MFYYKLNWKSSTYSKTFQTSSFDHYIIIELQLEQKSAFKGHNASVTLIFLSTLLKHWMKYYLSIIHYMCVIDV